MGEPDYLLPYVCFSGPAFRPPLLLGDSFLYGARNPDSAEEDGMEGEDECLVTYLLVGVIFMNCVVLLVPWFFSLKNYKAFIS